MPPKKLAPKAKAKAVASTPAAEDASSKSDPIITGANTPEKLDTPKKAGGSGGKKAGGSGSKKEVKKVSAAKPGTKKGNQKVIEVEKTPLQPSSLYRKMHEDEISRAYDVEQRVSKVHTTLERRIGAVLAQKVKSTTLKDLIREWDKNGDGDISKMEFRIVVRNKLDIKADNKEIDALFNSLDTDGGGQLDLSEIKPALQALQDAAAGADQEAAQLRSEAERLQARAAEMLEVAQATEILEKEELRLEELRNATSIEAKIGVRTTAHIERAAWARMPGGRLACTFAHAPTYGHGSASAWVCTFDH